MEHDVNLTLGGTHENKDIKPPSCLSKHEGRRDQGMYGLLVPCGHTVCLDCLGEELVRLRALVPLETDDIVPLTLRVEYQCGDNIRKARYYPMPAVNCIECSVKSTAANNGSIVPRGLYAIRSFDEIGPIWENLLNLALKGKVIKAPALRGNPPHDFTPRSYAAIMTLSRIQTQFPTLQIGTLPEIMARVKANPTLAFDTIIQVDDLTNALTEAIGKEDPATIRKMYKYWMDVISDLQAPGKTQLLRTCTANVTQLPDSDEDWMKSFGANATDNTVLDQIRSMGRARNVDPLQLDTSRSMPAEVRNRQSTQTPTSVPLQLENKKRRRENDDALDEPPKYEPRHENQHGLDRVPGLMDRISEID